MKQSSGLSNTIQKNEYIGDVFVVPGVQNFIGAGGFTLYQNPTDNNWYLVNGATGAQSQVGTGTSKFQPIIFNPGNPNLAPWTSQIAKLYRYWTPVKTVLEFRSNAISFNSISMGTGNMQMLCVYDARNADPQLSPPAVAGQLSPMFPGSKRVMETYAGCVSFKPQKSSRVYATNKRFIYPARTLNIAPYTELQDMAQTATAVGMDYNLLFPAGFVVGATGIPPPYSTTPYTPPSPTAPTVTTVNLGELWLNYAVKLMEPAPAV